MRAFRSRNLGIRRLSIVLAVVGGALVALVYSLPCFTALERERWDHIYFQAEIAKHPELSAFQGENAWYLRPERPLTWDDITPSIDATPAQNAATSSKIDPAAVASVDVPAPQGAKAGHQRDTHPTDRVDLFGETFPFTADQTPSKWDYLRLLLPVFGAALLVWVAIHTVAWVVDGFATAR